MTTWIVYRIEPGPLWGTRAVKLGKVEAVDQIEASRKAQEQWPDEKHIACRLPPQKPDRKR